MSNNDSNCDISLSFDATSLSAFLYNSASDDVAFNIFCLRAFDINSSFCIVNDSHFLVYLFMFLFIYLFTK